MCAIIFGNANNELTMKRRLQDVLVITQTLERLITRQSHSCALWAAARRRRRSAVTTESEIHLAWQRLVHYLISYILEYTFIGPFRTKHEYFK